MYTSYIPTEVPEASLSIPRDFCAAFAWLLCLLDVGVTLTGSVCVLLGISLTKCGNSSVEVIEAGFDSRFKKLQLTAAAYRSTSRLGIEVVYDAATGLFNTARSLELIYGFEVVASYRFNQALTVGGSYSYTEGKRDIDDNGKYDDEKDVWMNGRRIAAPKITGNINYTPLPVLDLTLNYTGIMKRDRFAKNASTGIYNGNEGKVSSYNLFNFAAAYRINKNTKLSLGIENIFNTDYFPTRTQWFMQPGFYSKGRGTAFTVGISVRY